MEETQIEPNCPKGIVKRHTRKSRRFLKLRRRGSTDELMLAGHKVKEALSVSEVLYICEQESIDAIEIAPDVDEPDVVEAQVRQITLRLKPGATTKDVIWELSLIFPALDARLQ